MITLAAGDTSAPGPVNPGMYLYLFGPACTITAQDQKGASVTFVCIAPSGNPLDCAQHLLRFPVDPSWCLIGLTNTSGATATYSLQQRAPLE